MSAHRKVWRSLTQNCASMADARTWPAVYTIPAHVPFADALAGRLLADHAGDLLELARARIFVPNRRAARSVADAFLRASGVGLLLPRLQALGDIDSLEDSAVLSADIDAALPPAVAEFDRLMALAPLISAWGQKTRGLTFSDAEVLKYARELARQIDQFDYAGVDISAVRALAAEGYAAHWQQILEFLDIIFVHARGAWAFADQIGPAARRVQAIGMLAAAWRENPPQGKIIVAGSTGTIPAVADLMQVIARLPHGAVVLPALDVDLPQAAWEALGPGHAQFALKQLLDKLDVNRSEIDPWWQAAPASAPPARTAFVNAALWPAAQTSAWADVKLDGALPGVAMLEAATDIEEARAIALHVRDKLQTPAQTIAIVTADRALARRIAAALLRFDIVVDDSAGVPLAQTLPAVFLRQLARAAVSDLLPIDVLALLKHPLCTGGMLRADWLARVRLLDKAVLRGPRPAPGLAGLRQASHRHPLALDLCAQLEPIAPLNAAVRAGKIPALELLHAHLAAAEALAADDADSGTDRLWRGEAGNMLSQLLGDLAAALTPDVLIDGAGYADWFEELLSGKVVRPQFGKHPRVDLLSPIEARLQRADVMILAGLNEQSWPPAPQVDPFFADHMREKLGLPTSEFRLGQSAHDFAQSLGAKTVLLTRAQKTGGQPALASRFWQRLEALAGGSIARADETLLLARALDMSAAQPVAEPLPTPPVAARPGKISVSDMSLWRQNPYAFYAKKILALKPLDEIDQDPGPLERGSMVHKALELFFKRPHGARTRAAFLADGEAAFADVMDRPFLRAFWWPRFLVLADAVLADTQLMVGPEIDILAEVTGIQKLSIPGHDLMIEGRADRIDIGPDGRGIIYDYKGGGLPSVAQIYYARTPQMALLALIGEGRGFGDGDNIRKFTVDNLQYVRTTGKLPEPVQIESLRGKKQWKEIPALLDRTLDILQRWTQLFENPRQPYKYLQSPDKGPGHDYALLARLDEWRGRTP